MFLVLVLAILAALVMGQGASSQGQFIHPPAAGLIGNYTGNPVWPINTTQHIAWTSTVEVYNISLWQQPLSAELPTHIATIFAQLPASTQVTSFDWVVQIYDTNLTNSNIFYLGVNDFTPNLFFLSHYFNVTNPTTLPTPTPTNPSSPTDTASHTPTSSTVTTSSPPSTNPQDDAANTARQLGLGIGLGLGIPILLVLVFLVILLFRRQRSETASDFSDAITEIPGAKPMARPGTRSEPPPMSPVSPMSPAVELQAQEWAELPTRGGSWADRAEGKATESGPSRTVATVERRADSRQKNREQRRPREVRGPEGESTQPSRLYDDG